MSRKKQLEKMSAIQIMDLLEKYKIDTNCKRTEAIKRILEHEGQPTKEKRPPRNFAPTKLKAARLKAGLTQDQFSKLAGINSGTLKHYEQGSKSFDSAKIDVIFNACLILNCKLDDIIENQETIETFKKYLKQ